MSTQKKLADIHKKIIDCRACPDMCGTPVHGPAIEASVMLIGQAPGPHESKFKKPFAFTSGKTLFKWFESTGVNEEAFREKVYIVATARCFPGKSGKGDRLPTRTEIDRCAVYVAKEVEVLKPGLIIAVGRLAITEVLGLDIFPKSKTLNDIVGIKFKTHFHGHMADVICLPHPSGVSRWPKTIEGAKKIEQALALIKKHPAWIKN